MQTAPIKTIKLTPDTKQFIFELQTIDSRQKLRQESCVFVTHQVPILEFIKQVERPNNLLQNTNRNMLLADKLKLTEFSISYSIWNREKPDTKGIHECRRISVHGGKFVHLTINRYFVARVRTANSSSKTHGCSTGMRVADQNVLLIT